MSEITHDTTNNNLRIHVGSTPGGHATLMEGQLGDPSGVAPLDAAGNVPIEHLGNVPKPISTSAAIVATTIVTSVQLFRLSTMLLWAMAVVPFMCVFPWSQHMQAK